MLVVQGTPVHLNEISEYESLNPFLIFFFFYHDFGVVVRKSEADRSHCKLNAVLVYTRSNSIPEPAM